MQSDSSNSDQSTNVNMTSQQSAEMHIYQDTNNQPPITQQQATSGEQQEEIIPKIDFKNFKELVMSKINNSGHVDWIFDETNLYRVTIHKDADGNLRTSPINGAIFTFNMNSGQLFLKVIHTSRWAGLTKLAQHSKIAASEELAALVRALPDALRPRGIYTTRSSIVPFLQDTLVDFPQIQLTGCAFFLPLASLMRLNRIKDHVDTATEPKLVFFTLYDDWLMDISPAAAFRRLMTLLQAIRRNGDAALRIINPKGESIGPERIWPKFSEDEWNQIEIQLRKLIVDNFATAMNQPVESISEETLEKVIYGDE